MSQNPNSDPNENPYEQTSRRSQSQDSSNTGYGGPLPPFNQPSPGMPPPASAGPNTPYSNYGPSYAPPPPGSGTGPNPYDPYGPGDPYAPTMPSSPQIPGQPPPAYPSQPGIPGATPSPPSQPPFVQMPPPRGGLNKKVIVSVLALIVLLGGSLLIAGIVHHNQDVTNTANANATATARVHATATAIVSNYPFSNHVVLDDPLTNGNHALQYGWDNYGINCFFANGTYHAVEHEQGLIRLCLARHTERLTNFTYQVQMTIKQGGSNAMGGLTFRSNPESAQRYLFLLDTLGNYQLRVTKDRTSNGNQLIEGKSIPGFDPGIGKPHVLGVVANGNRIALYVDKQKVTEVTNDRYTQGQIGVLSQFGDNTTEVEYNNAKVWTL